MIDHKFKQNSVVGTPQSSKSEIQDQCLLTLLCIWLSRINTGTHVCVCVRAHWCDMSTHPFITDVILYLYYKCICRITCLCCCKRKCFGIPLQITSIHVLKLMNLILVKLNCPVRDTERWWMFSTWLDHWNATCPEQLRTEQKLNEKTNNDLLPNCETMQQHCLTPAQLFASVTDCPV